MNAQIYAMLGILVVAAAIAGCNAYPTMERNFGNSVRQLVRNQQVPTGPVSTDPVEGGDADRLNSVFEVYRTDITRPEQPGQTVSIDIGSALSN